MTKAQIAVLAFIVALIAGILIYKPKQAQTLPDPSVPIDHIACHSVNDLPDPGCTPGATDLRVTQANIQSTICVSGYTQTVRPPVSYTNALKIQQMAEYGFTGDPREYEEDHLIPLEVGGDPTDPHNLWPEPGNSPNPKDAVENKLHKLVCSGRMDLAEAQQGIAQNWKQYQ